MGGDPGGRGVQRRRGPREKRGLGEVRGKRELSGRVRRGGHGAGFVGVEGADQPSQPGPQTPLTLQLVMLSTMQRRGAKRETLDISQDLKQMMLRLELFHLILMRTGMELRLILKLCKEFS